MTACYDSDVSKVTIIITRDLCEWSATHTHTHTHTHTNILLFVPPCHTQRHLPFMTETT